MFQSILCETGLQSESLLEISLCGQLADCNSRYLTIIKEPMDLQTVQAKLDSGMYANRNEFVKDIKLIVSNCIQYNGAASQMGALGKKFDSVFTNSECLLRFPRVATARTELTVVQYGTRPKRHSAPRAQRPLVRKLDLLHRLLRPLVRHRSMCLRRNHR